MSIVADCRVLGHKYIGDTICEMKIESREIANAYLPGQFVHIKCGHETLLRRPISICDRDGDSFRIVFALRGQGTKWLAARRVGEYISVLGPLGNGFDLSRLRGTPVFIGGGVGIPPMLGVLKAYTGRSHALLGFRTKTMMFLREDFASAAVRCEVSTDDGSEGIRGNVCDLLRNNLSRYQYTDILACGPKPMLQGIAAIAREAGIHCQVSLEERMACGVGACLVCACATKNGYAHVCSDGPVFDASEVIWDE